MTAETIDAFADHGQVIPNAIEAGLTQARRVLQDLEPLGIHLDCVTWQLQNEGVQKFIDPYNALMQALAAKRQEFLGKRAGAREP